MNTFLYYTQDFNVGASSTRNPSAMAPPYIPHFNLFANPFAMAPPYILGVYTSLLMGVHQAATTQDAVRKLHFDEST
jgi:hypothetical protein